MSEKYNVTTDDAIYQLTNAVLALSHVLAKVAPELTQGYLDMAAEASRRKGCGSKIIEEIIQTALPNAGPAVVLDPEEFAAKFGRPNS